MGSVIRGDRGVLKKGPGFWIPDSNTGITETHVPGSIGGYRGSGNTGHERARADP
jgi:hypothetical protein